MTDSRNRLAVPEVGNGSPSAVRHAGRQTSVTPKSINFAGPRGSDQRIQLPERGCPDEDIDEPGHRRVRTSEDRRDKVELEQAHKAPIDASNND
jgi:hypothetical protein